MGTILIKKIKKEISKDLQELPMVAASSFDIKEHQTKIHNETVQDLLKYFDKINEEQAKDIVRLFAMGKIRNLKITY
jgi:hypothetical protein